MANYCDTTKLEGHWLNWIIAKEVPDLEIFREKGILGTKIIGKVCSGDKVLMKNGQSLGDPSFPIRAHVVIINSKTIKFNSYNGKIQKYGLLENGDYIEFDKIRLMSKDTKCNFTTDATICQEYCRKHDYYYEQPTDTSWKEILEAADMICYGIAIKFRQKTEEESRDLSSEALIQIINKLKNGKLSYTPGKAPVFNLLTTTIYRCMFTIMNKRTAQREHQQKLIQAANNKALPELHSFKAQYA